MWVHPLAGSHPSSVQTLPSSHMVAGPPAHAPAAQVSPTVQALPSSHGALLSVCVHPVAGSQLSVVHTLPSSQSGAGPPTHWPPAHVSLVVQSLPSLQGPPLFTCLQPVVVSHESVVHTLLSSQLAAAPGTQEPLAHASFTVQALPSLQGSLFATCVQPAVGSHPSSVQGLLSLQPVAPPPTQFPAPSQ